MNHQPDPPIDLNHLNQISEGDTEFEIEILQVYLDDVLPRMREIREAIANNDWSKIMNQTHQVKGSSGNVGASQIEKLAIRLEELNRDRHTEKALMIIDEMFISINAVEGFVAQKAADFSG